MPPLTNQSLIMYFAVLVLGYLTYVAYSYRNRIWCTFRRADRTKVEKWAKPDQGRIDFDGGWYHVEPSRTVIQWKLILGFFPMPVRALDFSYKSARAFDDRDTGAFDASFDPAERKQLDKMDDIRGLHEANRASLQKTQKKGLLEQYAPFITIAAVVFIGYMLWQQQKRIDMIGNGMNLLQAELAKLLAR